MYDFKDEGSKAHDIGVWWEEECHEYRVPILAQHWNESDLKHTLQLPLDNFELGGMFVG